MVVVILVNLQKLNLVLLNSKSVFLATMFATIIDYSLVIRLVICWVLNIILSDLVLISNTCEWLQV